MQVLTGTAKGLIVHEIDGPGGPENEKVHFPGFAINMVYVDERTGRWWVGVAHKHWGQKLHYSEDQGKTWYDVAVPSFNGALLPNGRPAKLRQVWCMEQGGADHPNRLWLGTDPGGLFVSENNGTSFALVRSLWEHSSRNGEGQWFGAGSDFPFIHTIKVDPRDSQHVYIAVSCAGIFETTDGGLSWHPRNKGLVAAYLPNPETEVGHDPHQLLMYGDNPDILWQQNHCGIFYSKNGGKEWLDVSAKEGIPKYGFAIAMDQSNPARAWVIPAESDEQRTAPGLKLSIYETNNFGESWKAVNEGLPTSTIFDIVLRQSFCRKDDLMVFGTTNGNLYFSSGKDIYWKKISSHFTKVNAVCIC